VTTFFGKFHTMHDVKAYLSDLTDDVACK
jgi:hypothetical protein